MSQHDTIWRSLDRCVRLGLQTLEDDADQGRHREVGGPRVRAREAELRQLVLHARQEPRVVAAATLSVLAAFRVPTVGRERALPAIGLPVPRLEEGLDALIAGGTTP